VGREAVRGHDVEAHAGEQHHAGRLGLVAPLVDGLEDGELAGDVEIVGPGPQTGVDHRFPGPRERPGAVEDGGRLRQQHVKHVRFVQRRDLEIEL